MSIIIDRMELPRWYDENKIAFMVVNPTTAYLYWELAFSQCKALQGHQPSLRLFEMPAQQQHFEQPRLVKNIVLPAFTDNWYFDELQSGRQYQAEIGWEQNHVFFSILRSNTISMPPAVPLAVPSKVKWQPVNHISKKPTTPADRPLGSVDELIQQMSFYMGIKEVS